MRYQDCERPLLAAFSVRAVALQGLGPPNNGLQGDAPQAARAWSRTLGGEGESGGSSKPLL